MVDLDKLVCYLLSEDGYRRITTEDIFLALKQQGLEYKEGAIKPIKKPVNFEEFPRQEQLKWYICIKPIPQKDGGFMPLFCEGEHATIEKIFDMLPELKNDTALFTEHFRKVTDADLSKESDTESFDYEHATIKQKDFATTKKTDIEIKVGDWCVDKEGWYRGKPFKKIGENTKDKMLNGEMGTFFKAQFQDGSTFFPNAEHVRKATEAEIPVEKPTLSSIFKGEWYICIKPVNYFTVGKIYYAIRDWVLSGDLGDTVDVRWTPDCFRPATKEDIEKQTTRLNPSTIEMLEKPSIKKDQWIPQSGDRIRKKGTASPIYVLCSKTDIGFHFVEEMEVGIAGGELSRWALEDYELVERPKTIEEALDELFKPFMSHIKENEQKPPTIKFDEPDFERMEAEYCTTLDTPNGVIDVMIQSKMCSAYRQGLEDMWNKLVYKEV